MDNKHVSEALKEKKKAEESLKTSFFGNWSANHDVAAHHFEKAGQLFKLGKSFKESKRCYLEAAKQYDTSRVLFSAGKCYDAAGACSLQLGDFSETHQFVTRAGDYYSQNGTPSTAVTCYTKGAELLATPLPRQAAELYLRAGQLERDNEHPREAIKCFMGAKKVYAKAGLYKECIGAVELARQQYETMEHFEQIKKCNMTLVILHLARGDSIAAKQAIVGDVSLIVDDLISAVESGDEDTIKKLSSHGDIVYLDNEIAKIAKFLTQEGAVDVPKTKTTTTTTKPSTTTSSIFKSANRTSTNSQKGELFARPNKQNRDELFSKPNSSNSAERNELFGKPTKNQQLVPEVGNLSINQTEDANPFGYGDDNTESNNPFGSEAISNYVIENSDEDDLC